MKKEYRNLILLFTILSIITSIIILIFGRTYTLEFPIREDNFELVTEETDKRVGKIKILDQKQKGNNYYVKIKGVKPGKTFVGIKYEDSTVPKEIYIHKTMVLTEASFFGRSTGSEVIPISLAIILGYSIYIIFKKYRKSCAENLYQYRNISYISLIIFLLFFLIMNIQSIFSYHGIEETLTRIISLASSVSFLLLPIAILTFILVSLSNIQLMRKEGKSLRNFLGVLLGIFFCLLPIVPDRVYLFLLKTQWFDIYNLNSLGPYLYNFIEAVVYLTVSYLECLIIGTIVIAIKSVRRKVKYDKDYVIILGCQIKKDGTLTPLLKGRVDKALDFRNKQLQENNKDLTFICSGGQGPDEVISEGQAMKNYLLDNGIKESKILVDDKSKNTYENIKFSYALIKKKNPSVAFSTTNYHVLRAGLIATEQGLALEGMGSKTKAYFWINAFIREFIGTLYTERKKHIIVLIAISILLVILLYFTFISNNI